MEYIIKLKTNAPKIFSIVTWSASIIAAVSGGKIVECDDLIHSGVNNPANVSKDDKRDVPHVLVPTGSYLRTIRCIGTPDIGLAGYCPGGVRCVKANPFDVIYSLSVRTIEWDYALAFLNGLEPMNRN